MSKHEQVMSALDRANEIRFARAALKQRVAKGEVRVADIITNPPPEAVRMRLYDLLKSQWRWGRYRTLHLLALAHVSERKELGDLTYRQKLAIITELPLGKEPSSGC